MAKYNSYTSEPLKEEAKKKRMRILEIGRSDALRAHDLACRAKRDYAHCPQISKSFGSLASRFSSMITVA